MQILAEVWRRRRPKSSSSRAMVLKGYLNARSKELNRVLVLHLCQVNER